MQIQLVRERLAAAVAGVRGSNGEVLQCFGYTPDAVTPPTFYAGEVTLNPNGTFNGFDTARVVCRVLTSHSDDKEGQRLLDELLRRTGESSIRAALLAARGAPGELALGGACDDLNVDAIQGYRLYRVGADVYFGAEIVVNVIGDGEAD
jgi:hypothetical protein